MLEYSAELGLSQLNHVKPIGTQVLLDLQSEKNMLDAKAHVFRSTRGSVMGATCAAREEADAVNVYHSRALRARAEAIKMEIPSWTDPCAPLPRSISLRYPDPKALRLEKSVLRLVFGQSQSAIEQLNL